MPTIPSHLNRMEDIGCCSGGSGNANLSEQLDKLKRTVEEQAKQITELKDVLADKIDKSNLVTVYSLEDEPLFQAFPLDDK